MVIGWSVASIFTPHGIHQPDKTLHVDRFDRPPCRHLKRLDHRRMFKNHVAADRLAAAMSML
jgi:hypothetical protein